MLLMLTRLPIEKELSLQLQEGIQDIVANIRKKCRLTRLYLHFQRMIMRNLWQYIAILLPHISLNSLALQMIIVKQTGS